MQEQNVLTVASLALLTAALNVLMVSSLMCGVILKVFGDKRSANVLLQRLLLHHRPRRRHPSLIKAAEYPIAVVLVAQEQGFGVLLIQVVL
jgi:hypothetical protein